MIVVILIAVALQVWFLFVIYRLYCYLKDKANAGVAKYQLDSYNQYGQNYPAGGGNYNPAYNGPSYTVPQYPNYPVNPQNDASYYGSKA